MERESMFKFSKKSCIRSEGYLTFAIYSFDVKDISLSWLHGLCLSRTFWPVQQINEVKSFFFVQQIQCHMVIRTFNQLIQYIDYTSTWNSSDQPPQRLNPDHPAPIYI